jgi:hypothetical protein
VNAELRLIVSENYCSFRCWLYVLSVFFPDANDLCQVFFTNAAVDRLALPTGEVPG